MNSEKPILPDELKHSTGGRANGINHVPITLPSGGRGAAVSEIMSQPPSWLVRWGITMFLGVILLVLAVSWWVRYPELIKGNLRIVANNLPKSVVTRSEGQLMQLYVSDGQMVQKGQLLAQLETTARPTQVANLATIIDSLVKLTLDSDLTQAYSVSIPPFFELGELQKSYQSFQEIFIRTKSFVGDGTALGQIQELKTHLRYQLEDQESDFSLVKADLEMNERLLKEKVVSRTEYRQALSKYLNKKQAVEQSKSQIENNELAQNQKRQEILELDKVTVEQQNALLQSLRTLKSEIETWNNTIRQPPQLQGKSRFCNESKKIKP
jgi:multidrug efflux pump subunit AcrA (membrane-fusion protein)